MKKTDFSFELPEHLIAQFPLEQRTDSRLLVADPVKASVEHAFFASLPAHLREGDLLVFNNTRVIPARLYGRKETGGRVEIMVERVLGDGQLLAQMRVSKSPKAGTRIHVEGDDATLMVEGRDGEFFRLRSEDRAVSDLLQRAGHMPLPPYIQREDTANDQERYQTVYADKPGAVAAPTAGLHFDEDLLAQLDSKGINTAFITLQVGAGTFQPVRNDDLSQHQMHHEWLQVDESVCNAVEKTRAAGGRVVAVGTTSVRALETAASSGTLKPFEGDTNIFIYPGYRFRVVDALITNFHLPESTLIMLVSAFAGREFVLDCYREAVEQEYRFFSYGDAMFLTTRVTNK